MHPDFPLGQGKATTSTTNLLNGPEDAQTPKNSHLNTDYEFQGKTQSESGQGSAAQGMQSQEPQHLNTDYEFQGKTQSESGQGSAAQGMRSQEPQHLNTDNEFQGKTQTASGQGSSSEAPNVQVDFNQDIQTQSTNSRSASSKPKIEVDFRQGSASEPPRFEMDFRQRSSTEGKRDSTVETREGHESETKEVELEAGVTAEASDESQEDDSEGLRAELEGESHQFPMPPPRILTHPMAVAKHNHCIVFGHLSIMVANVSDEALLVPLKSPALADLLDNGPKYRAIALRCACELVFTRRIIVKRVVKWCRFAVLLIRGPSDAAIKRFRQCLLSANVAFQLAVPFNVDRHRPRLLASETLPDNLGLAVCSDRLGPASAAWERRLPLAMPQRKLGKPLYGKQPNRILPNNAAIGSVLSYVYPKWGFQTSKPIPHSQLFEAAVEEAMDMEKRQAEDLKK